MAKMVECMINFEHILCVQSCLHLIYRTTFILETDGVIKLTSLHWENCMFFQCHVYSLFLIQMPSTIIILNRNPIKHISNAIYGGRKKMSLAVTDVEKLQYRVWNWHVQQEKTKVCAVIMRFFLLFLIYSP